LRPFAAPAFVGGIAGEDFIIVQADHFGLETEFPELCRCFIGHRAGIGEIRFAF
jgi:hypothetical protein